MKLKLDINIILILSVGDALGSVITLFQLDKIPASIVEAYDGLQTKTETQIVAFVGLHCPRSTEAKVYTQGQKTDEAYQEIV
jgi:hypothetical protein